MVKILAWGARDRVFKSRRPHFHFSIECDYASLENSVESPKHVVGDIKLSGDVIFSRFFA